MRHIFAKKTQIGVNLPHTYLTSSAIMTIEYVNVSQLQSSDVQEEKYFRVVSFILT